MDRINRLRLLLDHDESLLHLNAGLRKQGVHERETPHDASNAPQEARNTSQYPSDPSRDPSTQDQEAYEQVHQLTPLDPIAVHDGSFCPVVAVSRFPYKFVKDQLSQTVASQFFDRGQFWSRSWDLQVRQFLQEINHALECRLSLPTESKKGILLPFGERNWWPQPIFLGKCTSLDTKERLLAEIPPASNQDQFPTDQDKDYLAWEQALEAAVDATKNSKKSTKAKQQQRAMHHQSLVQCLERTQRYLGLQPHEEAESERTWEAAAEHEAAAADWEVTRPMMYGFWKQPLLVSIDVECNERCHKQVTEVGISTLDLSLLVDQAPGPLGKVWTAQIASRHLRVREYGHIVNRDFVAGCPANFEFGTSEWVSERDLGAVVQASWENAGAVVLVGHNPGADLAYLRQLGVAVEVQTEAMTGIVDVVDTAETYRMLRGEATVRSLGGILGELGLTGWHLHNAGNDARYALEAMMGMFFNNSST
ncbi:hypothetical protein EYZ11_004422 [Aspergillus tanneri]|uniref:Gfd2/YDR514C-like C-terminal domain-containing protein n=1 Tax=Aspergillus tanneri TaxID=1220188 RepID=A0A4S3JL60_9EURO|nr:uncharacterized protein ATNIH1004_007728 [Aspergillus tanneri]KAA8646301.1 hypothetical protein ATNIH1004_007728 [Aspergillus tanneri]THC96100.1 hypothetical protein EYZ11_004422 [Aspergillus tanneri]